MRAVPERPTGLCDRGPRGEIIGPRWRLANLAPDAEYSKDRLLLLAGAVAFYAYLPWCRRLPLAVSMRSSLILCRCRTSSHMWNGPLGKGLFQTVHRAGTVRSYVRPFSAAYTAGLDEVRDARGGITIARCERSAKDGLSRFGISSPWNHRLLAPRLCRLLRRSACSDQLKTSRVYGAGCCLPISIGAALR
jgi:hypothetical protein